MSKISSTVYDSTDNNLIVGATVTLKDSNDSPIQVTQTDPVGQWSIDNPGAEAIASYIQVSYPGYSDAIYPSTSVPTVISMDPVTKTKIPVWVWVAIGIPVLVVGYFILKHYKKI